MKFMVAGKHQDKYLSKKTTEMQEKQRAFAKFDSAKLACKPI